jgi:LysR family glycine cleavage system transcriptional activator
MLRAFAAFAQAGNVVGAGAALGVSHAAISQHLRGLETELDVSLLDRSGRRMMLTPDGQLLARALEEGFGRMADTIAELTGAAQDRPLQISATPSFAAYWLLPRLPAFRLMHPDVTIMIDPTPKLATLGPDGIDVALRYGGPNWPGLETELLFLSPIVVVAAPALLGDGGAPTPQELADLPWLEELGTSESSAWLVEQGVTEGRKRGSTQLPGNMLLDALRDGQGVAVTVRAFVARDIEAGRLRVLHAEPVSDRGYHIVTRPGAQRPALKDFLRWLRRERARDAASVSQGGA